MILYSVMCCVFFLKSIAKRKEQKSFLGGDLWLGMFTSFLCNFFLHIFVVHENQINLASTTFCDFWGHKEEKFNLLDLINQKSILGNFRQKNIQ